MRGDEVRVVELFERWLTSDGWTVRREVEFCDVVAEKNGQKLFAEAKGRTAAIGLDVDTLYGQLLRRIPEDEVGVARFGVVIPTEARSAALRVPRRVRAALQIDIYVVSETGDVETLRAGVESNESKSSESADE